MTWREGGSIASAHWLPYALLALLVLATVLVSGAAVQPPRIALGAVFALLALAAWAALSLAWSPFPFLARDEALLTALYAAVLVVPLVTLRTVRDRLFGLAAVVGALGALAVATALELRFASEPTELFYSGRLNFPISYPNAQAAVLLVGFWPAIALCARRGPIALRAAALAAGVAMLATAASAQSKGAAVGLVVSSIVLFAVSPARLRLLVPPLVAAALVATRFRALTAPFRADTEAQQADAIRTAGTTVLVLGVVALALGAAYAAADSRINLSARARRIAAVAAVAGVVCASVAGVAAFFATVDRPTAFFGDQWEAFKVLPEQETGSSHLVTLGSNRYDFWRVSLREAAEHPLAGIGARGFGAAYLLEGRSPETPARAHSLPLDAASELGVVGLGLLVVALGLLFFAVARRARRVPAAAALAAATYWVTHASVDWIWTVPATGIPLFVLLGIGASPDGVRGIPRRIAISNGVAVLACAALVFAPPWLSDRLTARALEGDRESSGALRWARRLDPLSVRPYLAEAELARVTGSPSRAVLPLRRAVAKEPRSYALRYLLGLVLLEAGRTREARDTLLVARSLYPRSPLTAAALRRAARTP